MTPNRMTCVLALAVFAFGLMGCNADVRPPKPPKPPKVASKKVETPPEAPKDEAKPSEPVQPEVGFGPPILREKIAAARNAGLQPAIRVTGIRSSQPRATKDLALADALNVARTELMKQLDQLDPPIHTRPSMVAMRTEYLKGEARTSIPTEAEKAAIKASGPNLNANVQWVEIDLELTEHQVQHLRSSERVTDAFRIGGLLFALIAALYAFLRLDQWTKGYLTMWLGIGAGALVLGVAFVVFG